MIVDNYRYRTCGIYERRETKKDREAKTRQIGFDEV